jgi:hypothetical protein
MAEQNKSTGRLILAGGILVLVIFIAAIFMVNNWLKGSLQEMQVQTAQVPSGAAPSSATSRKNIRPVSVVTGQAAARGSASKQAKKESPQNLQIVKEAPILSKVLSE